MGQIEQHIFSEHGFEGLLRDRIYRKLGPDKDALKEINVDVVHPKTVKEGIMMARDFPQGLFSIKGLLALDDSGVGMKYFNFNIEQGLPTVKDDEIADELAFNCFKCVAEMKRERKKNPHKRKLILHG